MTHATNDAEHVYTQAVRPLPPEERLRVAVLILQELTPPADKQGGAGGVTNPRRPPRGPARDALLRAQAEAAMRDPDFVADMRETASAFAASDAADWPAYDGPEPEPFFVNPADELRDITARNPQP